MRAVPQSTFYRALVSFDVEWPSHDSQHSAPDSYEMPSDRKSCVCFVYIRKRHRIVIEWLCGDAIDFQIFGGQLWDNLKPFPLKFWGTLISVPFHDLRRDLSESDDQSRTELPLLDPSYN